MAIGTDKETQAAIKQQHRAKDKRNVAKQVADGERDMQVNPTLFAKGLAYGRRHGVDNAWNDPNAVAEFKKIHPEIVVSSGRSGVLSAPIGNHPKRTSLIQDQPRAPAGYKPAWMRNAENLVGG